MPRTSTIVYRNNVV